MSEKQGSEADAAGAGEHRAGSVAWSVADGVAQVFLDRPPVNVLDMRLMEDIVEAFAALRSPELRVVLVRSRTKAFSAGADVEEHRGAKAAPMLRTFHRMLETVTTCEAPTVAVVTGAALGGGFELALACDMRAVAAEAKLGVPEITLGVFPPWAALRLPELAGSGQASRLILSGEIIEGQAAQALGLAELVAPRADLEAALAPLVERLKGLSAASLRLAKQAILLSSGERAGRVKALETLYLGRLMETHDAEEGLAAFVEKREPRWLHR